MEFYNEKLEAEKYVITTTLLDSQWSREPRSQFTSHAILIRVNYLSKI
jgi:hypothetical protein